MRKKNTKRLSFRFCTFMCRLPNDMMAVRGLRSFNSHSHGMRVNRLQGVSTLPQVRHEKKVKTECDYALFKQRVLVIEGKRGIRSFWSAAILGAGGSGGGGGGGGGGGRSMPDVIFTSMYAERPLNFQTSQCLRELHLFRPLLLLSLLLLLLMLLCPYVS